MRSTFHELLQELEAEHERQLADLRAAASYDLGTELEKPDVRETMSAAIQWCGESQELSVPPVVVTHGNMDAASNASAHISETATRQDLEGAVALVESESPLTPMRRSSTRQHSARFEDMSKTRIAEKVLLVTSFLDGPGGVACYKNPLSSSSPSRIGWGCLWALYGAYGMYHMIRVAAMMFSTTLRGDDRMAVMLFFTTWVFAPVVPFLIFKRRFLSRCRAFAAAISTILSEVHADNLLDDLAKAVQTMQIRRLMAIIVYISLELILLFGPSRAPYRKLVLWPWPQTDSVSVMHAVVSSLNAMVFFMPDVDLIMLTTINHATLSLRNHLEKFRVKSVHEEYDFLCDFLEDYFDVEANTLKYPFFSFCISFLILATVFASHPDSHYLPYFLYTAFFFGAVFLKDMFTFADQNASIAALADAVFKRSFNGLASEDSLEDLHLRLCVTHRRPALVVLGVLELTRPGLVGLISFLLSLAFVIIFEMRT